MAVRNTVMAIPYQTRAAASFNGAFQTLGSPLTEACFLIRIVNDTDVDVSISYDGTTPHDYVRTNETATLSFQNNAQPNNYIANLPKGTQVYVRGTAGNGNIYVVGYFQQKQ